MNTFVIRQYKQISEEGWPAIFPKLKLLFLLPFRFILKEFLIQYILIIFYKLLIILGYKNKWIFFHLGSIYNGKNSELLIKENYIKAEELRSKAICYYKRAIDTDVFFLDVYKILYSVYMGKMEYEQMNRIGNSYVDAKSKLAEKLGLTDLKFRFIPSFLFTGNYGFYSNLATYTRAKIMGLVSPHESIVLLEESSRLSNPWICQYWEKYFTFIRKPKAINALKGISIPIEEEVEGINVINNKAVWSNAAIGIINKKWEDEKRDPIIKLSEEDIHSGWRELKKAGIPEGSWFVCLHVRTPGFKKRNANATEDVWDAHRNADINTYKKSIEEIVERGGWVLRMGDPYMEPLEKMEHVLDYANSDIRSHFMDVFCTAMCSFAVVTNSGYQGFAEAFEIPMVLTNYVSMTARARSNREIFIYKLLYSKGKNDYLSFKEGLQPPLGNAIGAPNYKSLRVEWVDNTEDEIHEVVVEMLERLEGKTIYTKEDQTLQKKFNSLHAKYSNWGGLGRIGNSFINKYEYLLNGQQ